MKRSKNVLPATPKKIKVEESGKKRGINTKGLIVVGVMIGIAVLSFGGYTGYRALEQAANDRWGLELEAGFERPLRNKVDITDVRMGENGSSLEVFLLARPERGSIKAEEFEIADAFMLEKLKEREEEVVIYVWSRDSGAGDYVLVSATICGIEGIVNETPQCQTQNIAGPLAKRHQRWLGAASDRTGESQGAQQ